MPSMGFGKRGGGSAVDIDSSALIAALERLQAAGSTVMHEVAPVLGEILVSHVHEVFEREGAVAGKPRWPDLAESTKKKRAKRQPTGVFKILQDTANLVNSIMPGLDIGDAIAAEAFTNVPYAGYHVSDGPRRKIPKRDFTDIDFESAQREAVEIILSQLVSTTAA